jgi:hypothetical protein
MQIDDALAEYMVRITLAAVCTILCACGATQPPKPDSVPPEPVPKGFTAAECQAAELAQAITEDGPGGTKGTSTYPGSLAEQSRFQELAPGILRNKASRHFCRI